METIQSESRQGRVADAPSGHWVYSALPRRLWPHAQLARWDRPVGWWLLLWPCWWSALMAANRQPLPDLPMLFSHMALYLVGAIAMRGAGCTYNDIIDRDIDAKVERTRSRPLPSGQISRRAAWAFLVAQALTGFVVLIQFNLFSILLGIASLGIVALYPFMKRVTDAPQLVLGLAFSWGALMGWAAVYGTLSAAPLLLYAGTVLWVVGYDTIYAHQDREDDALIGVRSTARLFADRTKPALIVLYGLALACFVGALHFSGADWPAFFGLGLSAALMGWQIVALDIDDPAQCLALFKSNTRVGWLFGGGLAADLALRLI
ncbi:MAG: 4-hydroxybenzoate octaprenyltransferase [Rhizobiaceae bacterium]|jgi:4-hydroxybenzoate polyprenyltransferase|nr:4-hydroxybenzoate octaprenyltransferase [Rhizobiaceae bacterium]